MRPEREVLKTGVHCNCRPFRALLGPENTSEAEVWHFQKSGEPRGGQQAAVQSLLGLGSAAALVCMGRGCSLPCLVGQTLQTRAELAETSLRL